MNKKLRRKKSFQLPLPKTNNQASQLTATLTPKTYKKTIKKLSAPSSVFDFTQIANASQKALFYEQLTKTKPKKIFKIPSKEIWIAGVPFSKKAQKSPILT